MQGTHLILFDGNCPVCNRAVGHILRIDREKLFVFSPLEGQSAKRLLGDRYDRYLKIDSLVLIENYEKSPIIRVYSKAALRIYWLLGGKYSLIGFLCFLPSFIGDFLYRLIASHRYRLNMKMPHKPIDQDRLLP